MTIGFLSQGSVAIVAPSFAHSYGTHASNGTATHRVTYTTTTTNRPKVGDQLFVGLAAKSRPAVNTVADDGTNVYALVNSTTTQTNTTQIRTFLYVTTVVTIPTHTIVACNKSSIASIGALMYANANTPANHVGKHFSANATTLTVTVTTATASDIIVFASGVSASRTLTATQGTIRSQNTQLQMGDWSPGSAGAHSLSLHWTTNTSASIVAGAFT